MRFTLKLTASWSQRYSSPTFAGEVSGLREAQKHTHGAHSRLCSSGMVKQDF